MLSSSEFCTELKKTYCSQGSNVSDRSSEDEAERNNVYDDPYGAPPAQELVAIAHQKKKELDYALSLDNTDSREMKESLILIAQDLYRWIEDHGINAIEQQQKLLAEMRDIRSREEGLIHEIADYKHQIAETNRELATALKLKRQYSLSCESLQSELELTARQLSREQSASTGRNGDVAGLRMRDSSRSLRELKRRNSRGILIESQNRVFQDEDHMGYDPHSFDEEYFAENASRKKNVRHRRDISRDIPNQDILVKAFYASCTDDDRYELTQESRSLSHKENLDEEEILSVREMEMVDDKRFDDIQCRMDKQEEKLDALIDMMQSMAVAKAERSSVLGYRSLGVVLMSVVCLAGYTSYQYKKRR